LTFLFYYLPTATLGAIVILAVLNLLEGHHMYKYLLLCCPSDLFIFVSVIVIIVFVSTEVGIYVGIGLSLFKLLYYLTRPFLTISNNPERMNFPTEKSFPSALNQDHGVIIFQPLTSVVFLNAESLSEKILDYALLNCKPPQKSTEERRIWSMDLADKGKKLRKDKGMTIQDEQGLFPLRGVVFDFYHVQFLDYTAIKVLMDLRSALQHIYTPPDNDPANAKLPFHFVHIQSHILPQLAHGGLLDIEEDITRDNVKKENDLVVYEDSNDLTIEHNGFTVRSSHLHHTVDNAVQDLFQSYSGENQNNRRPSSAEV
jgi:MFS superfamily sulfate permease-like transporter